MGQFLLIALGTFASEDLTCLTTGALIAAGKLAFVPGVSACLVGIYAGDLLLYCAGRFVGRPILGWGPFRKLLRSGRLDRASQWLAERGASVIIISRFTPGLRLPTYLAAGLLKTRFWTFAGYFLAAAAIWTPLLVGGAAFLGKRLPPVMFWGPLLLTVAVPWRGISLPRSSWHLGRRVLGWVRRKIQWEFWPPWLAYLPVLPYVLYLGIKYRCPTLFTAANPGIPSSGFVGESKSAILERLPSVPAFRLLPASLSPEACFRAVGEFLAAHDLSYPVVLKPDVGERGTGVVIARDGHTVQSYLGAATADIIVQQYIPGLEFGVFYYRFPGESQGRIWSITAKRFPEVTGDGASTLADLIWRDERAVCLAGLYLSRFANADRVPAAGEAVPLAELGSHCRGAVFLNAGHLHTEALRAAVDRAALSHPGFYFGRFDIRAASVEDLQAGRFFILELNGVSAEATHIYDPSVSLLEAYRVLFRHWRIAFEIGAANRRGGAVPLRLLDFFRLVAGLRMAKAGSDQRQLMPVQQQNS